MDKSKKPANDIRVSFNSKIGGIVSYCERLLKENNMRDLNFSAVGGSIGTLVSVVELLKTIHPGLYQINRFATISYQSVEEGGKKESENNRLYPKLEVKLTLDKPAKLTEGFQEKFVEFGMMITYCCATHFFYFFILIFFFFFRKLYL